MPLFTAAIPICRSRAKFLHEEQTGRFEVLGMIHGKYIGKCGSVEVYPLENTAHRKPSSEKVSGTPSTGTVQKSAVLLSIIPSFETDLCLVCNTIVAT